MHEKSHRIPKTNEEFWAARKTKIQIVPEKAGEAGWDSLPKD